MQNNPRRQPCKTAISEDGRRPNLITVLVDDMGWSDLSCFGGDAVGTENIDRLAAEGIRFTQFYVNSPICSPTRVALTTGQYPHRWRITSYLARRQLNIDRGMAQWLDPAAPLLARELQQNGYATGHFGKWHMGGQRDVNNAPPITEYGFDRSLTNFEGMGPKLLPLTLTPKSEKPGRIWQDAVNLGKPVTWMQRSEITAGFVEAALEFIDRAQATGQPFFVNVWPDVVRRLKRAVFEWNAVMPPDAGDPNFEKQADAGGRLRKKDLVPPSRKNIIVYVGKEPDVGWQKALVLFWPCQADYHKHPPKSVMGLIPFSPASFPPALFCPLPASAPPCLLESPVPPDKMNSVSEKTNFLLCTR